MTTTGTQKLVAAVATSWSVPYLPIVTRSSATTSSSSPSTNSSGGGNGIGKWKLVEEQFPVHRIYCVARNYKDHAAEMNADIRDPPFFFLKPADTAIPTHPTTTTTTRIQYPSMTSNLHFEGELAIALGKDQSSMNTTINSKEDAMSMIFGYAIACDLTRRDLQTNAKEKGRPWDTSKAFEECCPISAIVKRQNEIYNNNKGEEDDDDEFLSQGRLTTYVNDECRQNSRLKNMTWSVPEIIMHLSQYYQLKAGDLILTGTPAGVGPLTVGDVVRIQVQGGSGDDDDDTDESHNILPPCEFEIC